MLENRLLDSERIDYTILDDNIGYLRCESFQRGIEQGNLNDILSTSNRAEPLS